MMVEAVSDGALEPGFVRLEASIHSAAEPERIAALLGGAMDGWLAEAQARPGPDGMRRSAVDLRLRVGRSDAALATFHKAALLDLGPVRPAGAGFEAEIGWRAATAAPLFPVFSGRVVAEPGELRIEGIYAPPGGPVGRLADRVLLHTAANATARWLLRQLDVAAG
jgi:hypothetical protein